MYKRQHNQQIIITKKSANRHFTIDTLNNCAKIRLSRVQKQILFAFCRGGVSTTKSKITIKPSAKANFICILLRRSIYMHNRNTKSLRFVRRLLDVYKRQDFRPTLEFVRLVADDSFRLTDGCFNFRAIVQDLVPHAAQHLRQRTVKPRSELMPVRPGARCV